MKGRHVSLPMARVLSVTVSSYLVVGLAMAAMLALALGAQAATRTVGPGGPPTYQYATIQAAVDAADGGDTIQVAAGTYRENLVWETKDLQLVGAGAGVSIVDGDVDDDGHGDGSCVRVSNVPATARIEGFTFRKGDTDGCGGGIYCYESSPTIQNNTISDNDTFEGGGGGIYCGDGSSPTIQNNTISGNGADWGGGISCWKSSPTIRNNTISGNGVASDYYGPLGGGIHCEYSSATIRNNTISGNRAMGGGGIYCYESSPTIRNNTISGNWVSFRTTGDGGWGGGIYCYESSPTIRNNIISGNHARGDYFPDGGSGGGIYCEDSSPTIRNNTISGNGAEYDGGGICCRYGSSPSIQNNIVSHNDAHDGGGIYRQPGAGCAPTVSYCDVYGNAAGDYGGALADQTGSNGNIKEDPLFGHRPNGDFHLKSTGGRWTPGGWVMDTVHSPCIDAGDPASPWGYEPAPNGALVNMGAYGSTGQASKSDSTCALGWLNTPGYEGHGVDPDRANILDWYTFKVKYTGGPPSYVRLHLFRYGVEVAGSPMDMTAGAGDPATGQVFWRKRRLCKGTYSYFFRANDGEQPATGEPWDYQIGPIVHNRPPRLVWAGYGAWTSAPVDPQWHNLPGTEFTWKVKYIDREGDAPQYVRLHLARRTVNGGVHDEELAASPFDMTEESPDYMNGAVFTFSKTLNVEGRYVCWFEAKEVAPAPFTSNDAYGVPIWWHRGGVSIFSMPPRLIWAPGADYRGDMPSDGLHPNTGNVGDTFTFKVQYRGKSPWTEPTHVRLNLFRWNGTEYIEVTESPYEMSTTDTEFWLANYSVDVVRNKPGRYRYYFAANDGRTDAIGEPSWHRMLGPIVAGTSSAAQVSALSCCPTSLGAQVTFTLSADANVTAEIMNIAGHSVRLLLSERPMASGTNTLVWDGRNSAGLKVPAGTYIVRVRAADAAGAQAQALRTLQVHW